MESRKVSQSREAEQHREIIEKYFTELLMNIPYSEISISQLCKQLSISRKIFYRCYQSKDACLTAVIDNVLRESLLYNTVHMYQWEGSIQNCEVVMQFWKSKKDFLDMIVRNNLVPFFIARAIEFANSEDSTTSTMLNNDQLVCDLDILSYHICGHFALILQWYSRGFDTPVSDMARKYLRIIRNPLIAGRKR